MNDDDFDKLVKELPKAVVDEARKKAAARLNITSEKLAILMVKRINPYEDLTVQEECDLRGCGKRRLNTLRDRRLI